MNAKPLSLLVVEDSEDDALLLARQLRKGGYVPDLLRVTRREEIISALNDRQWDVVITDHNIPGLSSEAVLEIVQEFGLDVPFIIVSGSIGEEIAVAAMKTGAHDYIMKDNLARLVPAIDRELREVQTRHAHKKAQEVIEHLAYHDALTGLTNRHEFEIRVNRVLRDRLRQHDNHALLYIDLDQFKIINDTCGHIAGDELLKQLAVLIQHAIREHDTLARLGGDEFGVLLENCNVSEATVIAGKLLGIIKDFRFSWEGKTFSIGASIGLVQFNGDMYQDMTVVLSAADMACYAAKDLGRNRVHVYNEDDANMLRRHGEMQWVSRINMALEDDRFTLYQQKIVPVAAATELHHLEFLVRMVGEKNEVIPPGAFIPAAERYNLMTRIDHWVIQHAFRYLATLKSQDSPTLAFINLSGASLSEDGFFSFIRDQVAATGIQPQRVCFEITETAAIANLSAAVAFIQEIRAEGFRFALDDFGVGLSSFSYLKTIPVDFLKVDGSFIRDMLDDPMDAAIVESINRIGHVAGLQTIAEFVESDAILARLREIGFDLAQGYAIHMPGPIGGVLPMASGQARSPSQARKK